MCFGPDRLRIRLIPRHCPDHDMHDLANQPEISQIWSVEFMFTNLIGLPRPSDNGQTLLILLGIFSRSRWRYKHGWSCDELDVDSSKDCVETGIGLVYCSIETVNDGWWLSWWIIASARRYFQTFCVICWTGINRAPQWNCKIATKESASGRRSYCSNNVRNTGILSG